MPSTQRDEQQVAPIRIHLADRPSEALPRKGEMAKNAIPMYYLTKLEIKMNDFNLSRRGSFGLAALVAGAAALPAAARAQQGISPAAVPFRTEIDFKDPIWNRDTYARLDGNVDLAKPPALPNF